MYEAYFGLKENPFSIAPDPRYLYMSEKHQEALAHLMYSLSGGNRFVLLTGEVGTGKTTLCRGLLGQLPEDVDVALILNPRFNAVDLLAAVCDELGISYPKGELKSKTLNDLLVRHLLDVRRKGRRTFLIIDEAQNLGVDVLEEVRLLTNLETSEEKLLQIILIGQPELRDLLAKKELRQLSQRITARYHLDKLTRTETSAYIEHRLSVAGCPRVLFNKAAIATVHAQSRGIPRLINTICDRSLLGAYAEGKGKVDKATVKSAADEVLGEGVPELPEETASNGGRTRLWLLLLLLVASAALAWVLTEGKMPRFDLGSSLPKVEIPSLSDDSASTDPSPASAQPSAEVLEEELGDFPEDDEAATQGSSKAEDETPPQESTSVADPSPTQAVESDASDSTEDNAEPMASDVKASDATEDQGDANDSAETAAVPESTEQSAETHKPAEAVVSKPVRENPALSGADKEALPRIVTQPLNPPDLGKPLDLEMDLHATTLDPPELGFTPNQNEESDAANGAGAD